MILYTFMSSYQLLECIENKLLFHKDEEALLMVYPFALDKFPNYRELIKLGIFTDAFIFESGKINYNSNTFVQDVERVFNENSKVKLEDIEKFVIFGAHMPITIYLIENEKKFELGEDGSGAYSRPELLYEIEKKSFESKFNKMDCYGLYNLQTFSYPNIERMYFNIDGQREPYEQRAELYDFNLTRQFKNIPAEYQKPILEFFNCPLGLTMDKAATVLFTQQFSNLKQMTFESQIQIYKLLFDIFLDEEKTIIKVHPDDVLFYEILFPDSVILREKFPAELLPFISDSIPRCLATITSSSLHMFSSDEYEKLSFFPDYERNFKYTFRYDFIYELCIRLGIKITEEVGTIKNLILNIENYSKLSVSKREENFKAIIVDDFLEACIEEKIAESQKIMDEADQDTVIIFMNCLNDFSFYTYEKKTYYENVVPIILSKVKITEEYNYWNVEDEVIFIYTLNKEIKRNILEMKKEKEYVHSGIKIKKEELSGDKLRIKVLEGQLRATEARLLRYIQKEQEDNVK